MKLYDVILCDAPWTYDNAQQNDPKRGGITYDTMTMQELHDLPMHKCMKPNSIMFFWVTLPKLVDSYYSSKEKVGGIKSNIENPLSIIHAWGFRPVTAAFVWVKLTKNGYIHPYDTLDFGENEPYWEEDKRDANCYDHIKISELYSGLGRYTNSNVELCLVCRRGKGLPRVAKNVKQVIFAPIGEHSAKPQIQYERIHRLYGDVNYLEIFARKQNPPPVYYDAVGLDWEPSTDIREWIKQY